MAAEVNITIELELEGEYPWDHYADPIMGAMNGYGLYGISNGRPFIDTSCEQVPALLERLSHLSGVSVTNISVESYTVS